MAHNFLDNKVIMKMYKHGILVPGLLASFKGIYSFVTDLFTNFHVMKLFSSIFGLNSFLKNLHMSFKNYYYESLFVFNLGWLLHRSEKKIEKRLSKTKAINLENFNEALKCNTPLIFLTAHTGLYYLCIFSGFFFPQNRDVVMFVPKQFDEERKKIMEVRIKNYQKAKEISNCNFQTIDLQDKYNLVKVLGIFRKNGMIACTCDFAFPFTRNRVSKFCNMEKEFPVGIIEMGLKFNANIIPVFNYMKNGSNVVEYGKVIRLKNSNNKEQDINRYSTTIIGLVEAKACELPEQYILWKTLFFKSQSAPKPEEIIEINNMQYTFIYHGGVYFTKNYFKNKLDPHWISSIKNYLPESYNLISDYIYLSNIPPMLFADQVTAQEIAKSLSINRSTKAFSRDGKIYSFFYQDEPEWKKIINREMYLCGVYQFFEGKKLIPDWFNEFVSLHINKDHDFKHDIPWYFVNNGHKKIVAHIMQDSLLSECDLAKDIIKSFEKFFFEKYECNTIKSLFMKVKEMNSFEKGLSYTLGYSIQTLLDSWLDYIKCSIPNQYCEFQEKQLI